MIPKLFNGKTKCIKNKKIKYRKKQYSNCTPLNYCIKSIRCMNRSMMNKIIVDHIDEISIRTISDSDKKLLYQCKIGNKCRCGGY